MNPELTSVRVQASEAWLSILDPSAHRWQRQAAAHLRRAVTALRKPAPLTLEESLARTSARVLAERARRRAVGLCQTCGKRPPAEGKASCDECLSYWRGRKRP